MSVSGDRGECARTLVQAVFRLAFCDYIGIVSGPHAAYLVWTDSRDAARCRAVNDYRELVYGGTAAVAPNPDTACSTNFGNTDTYEATVSY